MYNKLNIGVDLQSNWNKCVSINFFLIFCYLFDHFSCRTQQNLPELPLSAHLLAPIQRICRYPLHLSELVKNSPSKLDVAQQHDDKVDHSVNIDVLDSKETFELALAAMKRVTEMVNEGSFIRQLLCSIFLHEHFRQTQFLFLTVFSDLTINTLFFFHLCSFSNANCSLY